MSSKLIERILAKHEEHGRRCNEHVTVKGEGEGDLPVEERAQRPGSTASRTGVKLKKVPPKAKVRPSRQKLGWHQAECHHPEAQNGPPR